MIVRVSVGSFAAFGDDFRIVAEENHAQASRGGASDQGAEKNGESEAGDGKSAVRPDRLRARREIIFGSVSPEITMTTALAFRLVASFCLAACASAAAPADGPARFVPPPAAVCRAVEQAVLETNAKMNAAANRLDADGFFEFILEADTGMIVQNGICFKSRAEALASVKSGFQNLAAVDRQFENPRVTALSADSALLVAEGRSVATLLDGRSISSRFAVSLVFVRQMGRWRLLHGHYSIPAAPRS